ncbi:hypothetical protein AB0I10_36025 [Streptomyces sp. NPDC050636]|uniref:hypothetical protein n=1 Tax=Streptomyces sp. NPDC050636 TaxID=3154510 RepID=UPI003417C862
MHKFRNAAVVAAVLASVGLLGAGTAYAGGGPEGGDHSRIQSNRVDSPQQQLSREDSRPQQLSGERHHSKSHGHRFDIRQKTSCRSHESNVGVLGNVGILNGALANAGGGEGDAGTQHTRIGSSAGCNNIIRR